MNPRVGVPILVALLLASSWAFTNEAAIDAWVEENQVQPNESDADLLGIQTNEQWLVLVTEFPDDRASEAWGTSQAQLMLDDVARSYIEQLTDQKTELTVLVHPKISLASDNVAIYGADSSGGRDTNSQGEFLPMKLAEEVINQRADDVNWTNFDLDDDGNVDRVLILHTTKGQEENPGQTNKIWKNDFVGN